ncbi:phage terminase small subunit [Kineosporia succinea]|uniref:phage terminase small subunit n=1 Tax=Kineosporia succinea TaxID=84632 RepID=UPI000AB1CDD0
MGISGPAPKPASRRARNNRDPHPYRTFPQPDFAGPRDLPDDLIDFREEWHPAVLRWWSRWCESPLSSEFSEVEWSELEVAAALLQKFWTGSRSVECAGELRQRMSQLGATPEARQKLRIAYATADEKEQFMPPAKSSRERYGSLTALPQSKSG